MQTQTGYCTAGEYSPWISTIGYWYVAYELLRRRTKKCWQKRYLLKSSYISYTLSHFKHYFDSKLYERSLRKLSSETNSFVVAGCFVYSSELSVEWIWRNIKSIKIYSGWWLADVTIFSRHRCLVPSSLLSLAHCVYTRSLFSQMSDICVSEWSLWMGMISFHLYSVTRFYGLNHCAGGAVVVGGLAARRY